MNFSTRCEPYLRSTPGTFLFLTGLRILFRIFRTLGTVARAADAALIEACGVELAAHNSVADVDVLNAAGAQNYDRVLLQVVAFTRDVGGNLHAVGKAHAGDFADGGGRLSLTGGRRRAATA